MSPNTRLLMIMNGLIEDDLIEMLKTQREAKGLEGVGLKAIYGEISTNVSFLFVEPVCISHYTCTYYACLAFFRRDGTYLFQQIGTRKD